ncbi:FAD-dependent oxidoreductase [Rhodococcus rhodochrous]|uniref:NAD(P)/FAD-dependent oxidoreductase n=1 Tax=Rhodococcus rhodochrous TaxID=1829 RepID=UPI001E5E9D4F|nr:FAD-dependent oxidoreductase [Rhodococcus rhodochrous]MCB8914165.1 FAD-dependent oxidoreductase [Rhodococcus rhodochrous]
MIGSPQATVVVVGASLAALRTVESLRSTGHSGEIIVFGDEPHAPYDRPPLSKAALKDPRGSDHELAQSLALPRREDAQAQWHFGSPVVRADLTGRQIHLADHTSHSFDLVIAATGLRPRTLNLPGPQVGRHTVRTVEDARTLAVSLVPGARLVIIGASFIGCEIASIAGEMGTHVAVVDPCAVPMGRVLGAELGGAIRRSHEARGVDFHLGRTPVEFNGDDRITGVVLDDGTRLSADVVVEAVGCRPETAWLDGNGLDLTDGILTDNRLVADGSDRLLAVGDVARFPNPFIDNVPRRVEHWAIAGDTGRQAAATIAGQAPEFAPVPSFWSDQLDTRIQGFGAPALADEIRIVHGNLSENQPRAVAEYRREGRLIGVVGIGLRKELALARARLVAARSTTNA